MHLSFNNAQSKTYRLVLEKFLKLQVLHKRIFRLLQCAEYNHLHYKVFVLDALFGYIELGRLIEARIII